MVNGRMLLVNGIDGKQYVRRAAQFDVRVGHNPTDHSIKNRAFSYNAAIQKLPGRIHYSADYPFPSFVNSVSLTAPY